MRDPGQPPAPVTEHGGGGNHPALSAGRGNLARRRSCVLPRQGRRWFPLPVVPVTRGVQPTWFVHE